MLNSLYLSTCAFIKQINITQKGSLSHTYKAPRTHTLTHRWALPKAQAKGGMSSSSEPKSCKKQIERLMNTVTSCSIFIKNQTLISLSIHSTDASICIDQQFPVCTSRLVCVRACDECVCMSQLVPGSPVLLAQTSSCSGARAND